MTEQLPRIQVTLPTYNEAGNIESLTRALLALRGDVGIIIIDDDSPDGTWRIVERLAAEFPGRIVLLHRRNERGRGSAGVAGFRKAIALGADYIVEMDADWSHDPRFLPALLNAAMGEEEHGEGRPGGQSGQARQTDSSGADVVIGSRLVQIGRAHV